MAELADAQVSGACGVTPVWVQVPPLALRHGRKALPRSARLAIAGALSFAACAPFDAPYDVGPPNAIVARLDGPAAHVTSTGERVVAAFVRESDGIRTLVAWPLSASSPTPRAIARAPSSARLHPPLGFTDGDRVTLVWRALSEERGREIQWSREDASGAWSPPRTLLLDDRATGRLAGQSGAEPTIAIALAAGGRASTPGPTTLRVWQNPASAESGWKSLGSPLSGFASGYSVVGTAPGRAIAAWIGTDRRLQLQRITASSAESGPATSFASRPAAPSQVWLTSLGERVLAAWSEWSPGAAAAVNVSRSQDGGASWTTPGRLAHDARGAHPLASFDRDGATVAAVWRSHEKGADRILLALSRDFGATFTAPTYVDAEPTDGHRTRPRVAIRGTRVLVAWQEGDSEAVGGTIRASLSDDLGRSLAIRGHALATTDGSRAVRDPQPWLSTRAGGVLWESAARRPPTGPTTGPAPRVSLHGRRLRG